MPKLKPEVNVTGQRSSVGPLASMTQACPGVVCECVGEFLFDSVFYSSSAFLCFFVICVCAGGGVCVCVCVFLSVCFCAHVYVCVHLSYAFIPFS